MLRGSVVLLAAVAATAIAADAPIYHFDLTVRVGAAAPLHVRAALPAATYRVTEAGPALEFDLIAPADGRSPTIVRLRDLSGAEPTVLHTAQRGGPPSVSRSSTYTVCKEGVYFESPTPQVSTAQCREQGGGSPNPSLERSRVE